MNNENSIVECFGKSMFCPELADVCADIAEEGLDSILTVPALQGIPIIKSINAVVKTAISVKEKYELKKQLVFLQSVSSGVANPEEIEKRKRAYETGEKWFYREVENTIVYLSRHARIEKVKIQAILYLDYINGEISEEKYNECLDVLDMLIVGDIPLLMEIYEAQSNIIDLDTELQEKIKDVKTRFEHTKCGRLNAAGLVCPVSMGLSFGTFIDNNFVITDLGRYFCNVVKRLPNKN